jgi:hypothetical protein
MFRRLLAIAGLCGLLSACADVTQDLEGPLEPLGDFKLGHAEVVAPSLEQLLVSRDATSEEWIADVDRAMETRFSRFQGDAFYHIGVSVEAYSLPPPVIPGKSALAMRVTIWEDATQTKLNSETELITVIEVFESRLALTREEQMTKLAEKAAKLTEDWMRERMTEDGWFMKAPESADPLPEDASSAS